MDPVLDEFLRRKVGIDVPSLRDPLAAAEPTPDLDAPPEPPAPVPEPTPAPQDPKAALYARLGDISGLKAAQDADRQHSAAATLAGMLSRSAGLIRNDQHVPTAAPVTMDDNVRRYLQQKQAETQALTVPMELEHKQALVDQAKAHAQYWAQGGRAPAGHIKVTPENRDGVVAVLGRMDPKNAAQYAAMSEADLEVALSAKAQVSAAAGAEARADAADKKDAAKVSSGGTHGKHGGNAAAYSEDAINAMADSFAKGVPLAQLVGGRAIPDVGPIIVNRAAQRHPDLDVSGAQAELHANRSSLNSQQKLLDMTTSWEATGKANLGVLRSIAGQLVDSGSPLVNKPLRAIFQGAGGDPTIAKFKAAHAAVVNEYAKILSGSTSSAGVTDAARREANDMLPLDATLAQLNAAADVLETDAGNRLSALSKGVESTKARTSSRPAPAATGGTVTVMWKGKAKTIPAERLDEALKAGATRAP